MVRKKDLIEEVDQLNTALNIMKRQLKGKEEQVKRWKKRAKLLQEHFVILFNEGEEE